MFFIGEIIGCMVSVIYYLQLENKINCVRVHCFGIREINVIVSCVNVPHTLEKWNYLQLHSPLHFLRKCGLHCL